MVWSKMVAMGNTKSSKRGLQCGLKLHRHVLGVLLPRLSGPGYDIYAVSPQPY